MTTIKHGDMN